MRNAELADTVIRQIECLWILQEITHELSTGNKDAERLLQKIYHRRNPNINWRNLNFLEIRTSLAMLMLPVCLLSKLSEGELDSYAFTIREEHTLVYRENGAPAEARPVSVLCTMRNAIAHLPDFAAGLCDPNVSFDEGILRLWSERKKSEVVFNSRPGFVSFVSEITRVARIYAVQLGNPQ